jgi:DNA-binding PadR family transcriptional regulator
MNLEYILLGLLSAAPASGYDLKREFQEGIGHFWAAEISQIYTTLKRLAKRRWVRATVVPSDKGPPRRVYEVTPAGRAALRAWLASGPQFGDQRITFLAQLYLLHGGDDADEMRAFLRQTRDYFERRLAWLREAEATWLADCPGGADGLPAADLGPYMTLRAGIHAAEARLAWCDESLGRLEGRPATAGRSRPKS